MCVQQRQAEPTCRSLCACVCAQFMTNRVCVFIPVCASMQKSTCTCVCLQVCCTCVCLCVCVCSLCAQGQLRVQAHVSWAGAPGPVERPAGLTLSLCPPCPSPAPASHPPEGSEAEWRHRYRSVLGPCPLLHGACLACALELPGHLWEQPGCRTGPSQPDAHCLALLCLRWHPEPGLRPEKWHSDNSPSMQAQPWQCAHCALLQVGQELWPPAILSGGGHHLPCTPWAARGAPIPAHSFPGAW